MDVRPSTANLASLGCDVLVLLVPEGGTSGELTAVDAAFDGQLSRWLTQKSFTGSEGSAHTAPTLGRLAATTVVVSGIGAGSASAVRAAVGKATREARAAKAGHVAVAGFGAHARAAAEGAGVGTYAWERKAEKDRTTPLTQLTLVGATDLDADREGILRARQDWVRDLVNAPPAELYPASIADEAQRLASIPGVTVTVWDEVRLRAEGCVGLIGVGQGSIRPPRLIHIAWRPADARGHVALVGKGITFDSGGLSLKPSGSMQTMRCDMAGAATVLGAIGAAADLKLPLAVDAWVAAAENMTGGDAYKLGDIFTYANGVTVEIHNTDAEGRLVLADALIQACKLPATDVLDLATLTGACVVALGSDFTGLFTHDDALATELLAAGSETGELLWRLPLHKPYKDQLKADWAQLKNVGSREAGATTAALFLEHFVTKDKRWAHLDIAGPAFLEKASGPYAAGGTGHPMRAVVRWLEQRAKA